VKNWNKEHLFASRIGLRSVTSFRGISILLNSKKFGSVEILPLVVVAEILQRNRTTIIESLEYGYLPFMDIISGVKDHPVNEIFRHQIVMLRFPVDFVIDESTIGVNILYDVISSRVIPGSATSLSIIITINLRRLLALSSSMIKVLQPNSRY
jgi:hypothetical protein